MWSSPWRCGTGTPAGPGRCVRDGSSRECRVGIGRVQLLQVTVVLGQLRGLLGGLGSEAFAPAPGLLVDGQGRGDGHVLAATPGERPTGLLVICGGWPFGGDGPGTLSREHGALVVDQLPPHVDRIDAEERPQDGVSTAQRVAAQGTVQLPPGEPGEGGQQDEQRHMQPDAAGCEVSMHPPIVPPGTSISHSGVPASWADTGGGPRASGGPSAAGFATMTAHGPRRPPPGCLVFSPSSGPATRAGAICPQLPIENCRSSTADRKVTPWTVASESVSRRPSGR